MTNDEKYELTQRLRQLANAVDDGKPLQRPDVFSGEMEPFAPLTLLRALRDIRVKPELLEEWKVMYKGNNIVSSNSKESAEEYVKQYPDGFERIIHMREVTE